MNHLVSLVLILIVSIVQLVPCFGTRTNLLKELQRQRFQKRGHTWPPKHYIPDTPGWKELFEERFSQIQQIEDLHDRYNAYIHSVYAGLVAPNFTELGFALARAPEELTAELLQGIQEGIPSAKQEPMSLGVEGPLPSLFVERRDLLRKVLHDLKDHIEAWAGVPLVPHVAYGFRLYRNQSYLGMHVDRRQSHVISFILHIGSSEDSEPWPIVIEDFQGNTHEVILTSGDILFYESSKCFHGRPGKFNGSWYSSVFSHYYPVSWADVDYDKEAIAAVPPSWRDNNTDEESTISTYKVRMGGTTMYHPECPNQWCVTKKKIQWSGPGEDGYWISPDMKRYKLNVTVPKTPSLAEEL